MGKDAVCCRIERIPVSQDRCQDSGAPLYGMVFLLKYEHRSTFGENHSVPSGVEGTTDRLGAVQSGQAAEVVKPVKRFFAQLLDPAREDNIGPVQPDKVGRIGNSVKTGAEARGYGRIESFYLEPDGNLACRRIDDRIRKV
jgi:hypothetical protein